MVVLLSPHLPKIWRLDDFLHHRRFSDSAVFFLFFVNSTI